MLLRGYQSDFMKKLALAYNQQLLGLLFSATY